MKMKGKWTRWMWGGALLLAWASFLACESEVTGPDDDEPPEVSGSWSYEAPQMEGSNEDLSGTCSATGATLTLHQSGPVLSGSVENIQLACDFDGEVVEQLLEGPITSGTIEDDEIAFDFGSADWTHSGTVSGHAMSGTVELVAGLGDATVLLVGEWTAQRN